VHVFKGKILALLFIEVFEQMGLLESLFTVTCDNASNMTVRLTPLKNRGLADQ
jgi:hypothetical protein